MSPLLLSLLSMTMGANPEAAAKVKDGAKLDDTARIEATAKFFEEHTYTYTGGDYKEEPFKWRLLKPETIDSGKKYPVILFLHGAGERGDDGKLQLKYFGETISTPENRQKYPCFVIIPQCRVGKEWANYKWDKNVGEQAKNPSDQAKVALGILDEVLKTYPCDEKRLYLTGISMGGYGSWDLATRDPDKFACIVPICGGGPESQAAKLIKLPIWCFHGDADTGVPVERSRKMIAAVKAAGGEPKYTEYPGVGHNSWERTYNNPEVIAWIFEQKKE